MKINLRQVDPTLSSFGALNCSFYWVQFLHGSLKEHIYKHLEPLHIMAFIQSPGTGGGGASLIYYFAHSEQSLQGMRSLCILGMWVCRISIARHLSRWEVGIMLQHRSLWEQNSIFAAV